MQSSLHFGNAGRHSFWRLSAFGVSLLFAPVLHAQQPLTLAEAIRAGLAASPQAHTSADQVELQRAQIAGARLRPNPRFYVTSEDLRPWADDFSFPTSTEDYGYFSQTVELDGKRGKRIAYAQTGLNRSQAQHLFQLRALAASIAGAYWYAETTRSVAEAWRLQLDGADRLVQYQSDRVKAGATAGVDLLRTQIERDRVSLYYAQAQRDAEAAAIELARVAATPAFQNAQLADPLEAEGPPIPELPLTDAVEQRPDVVAARDALKEAQAGLRLQHAYAVPDLDFIGGYKRNLGINTAYGGLQIDIPLFNRNQGGVATATAQTQLADDQLAYVRLLARSEIETAEADYRREQGLVRSTLPGATERARQNAAIIEDAYRTGGADLLRLLDAERVRIDTRLLAIQTWNAYHRAAVALQLAYGEQP